MQVSKTVQTSHQHRHIVAEINRFKVIRTLSSYSSHKRTKNVCEKWKKYDIQISRL
jgi:hypothetical protein